MKKHSIIDLICKAVGIPLFCAGVAMFIGDGTVTYRTFFIAIELLFIGMLLITDWE